MPAKGRGAGDRYLLPGLVRQEVCADYSILFLALRIPLLREGGGEVPGTNGVDADAVGGVVHRVGLG